MLIALAGAAFLWSRSLSVTVPYASDADAVRLPDGRSLAFTCMGKGSPTVILTPGMGDIAAMAWGSIQPNLAEITRVCAWDRPGFALSDGIARPQNVGTTTDDLVAALSTGAIPGPYVMVGHSLGSFESLLFADRQREKVVGMVLIDPSFPGQHMLSRRIYGAVPDANSTMIVQRMRSCAAEIRSGRSRLGGPDPSGCFEYPANFSSELSQALGRKVSDPIQYETMASFLSSFPEDSALAMNADRNYGAMPLRVLSAVGPIPQSSETPSDRAARIAAFWAEGRRAHAALAALSTRGIHVQVEGADHYIQTSQPRAVIDAVAEVVEQARAGMAG